MDIEEWREKESPSPSMARAIGMGSRTVQQLLQPDSPYGIILAGLESGTGSGTDLKPRGKNDASPRLCDPWARTGSPVKQNVRSPFMGQFTRTFVGAL